MDYIELNYKGPAGGLRRAVLGNDGRGRGGGSFRGGDNGRGRGFGRNRNGVHSRGRGGGGFGNGRGSGGFGRGRASYTKKQKCRKCKERGHYGDVCPYTVEEAASKIAAALQKHADAANNALQKNAAASAASAESSSSVPVAHKPPFAGWKPGFVMPPPPTNAAMDQN